MTQVRQDQDPVETQEWLDAFTSVLEHEGSGRAQFIITQLLDAAEKAGLPVQGALPSAVVSYLNTISSAEQPAYPGDLALEAQLDAMVRWNAIAMVLRAKKYAGGVGGHLSSYASIATLYEVGLNHFFRGAEQGTPGDLVYFQGHSSEGNYARAFLEGRLSAEHLLNFRQEVDGKGVSSYPHPWLMPDFWQFATVSLGLGPLQAIYQARFIHYLVNRKLLPANDRKVWVFCGDGEMDEVESVGALTVAVRERLDNIVYVVNCNLQRLDGLVRGNGKIVTELEGVFRGAGWHVIKVLWGSEWDAVFARDAKGLLQKRLAEIVDGELQYAQVHGGAALRQLFCQDNPELLSLFADYSDAAMEKLGRGAHDPVKIYAAYAAAVKHKGQPVAILAQGIKGYGLGTQHGESRNVAHNQLEMSLEALQTFRERFSLPLTDEQLANLEFYHPGADHPAIQYLQAQRNKLRGWLPARLTVSHPLKIPELSLFDAILKGTGDRSMSTTMVLGRIFNSLLKDPVVGPRIVPIFSDEVRTFGLEALFRQIGIYAAGGARYKPEDHEQLMYYREAEDGQLLEEGITEAGCMATWLAAATSHSTHQVPMIPFFTYYSMFGFQRVGDLIWAACDMRARGFLIGATAGRTTLEGEGLQHQDGTSLLTASTFPSCRAYDPAFGYEMAVIVRQGLEEMYAQEQDVFYYVMAMNEKYVQPAMPAGVEEGIVRGMYLLQAAEQSKKAKKDSLRVQLLGSGAILREVLFAAELLANDFAVAADVWSVTSYSELRRDAARVERENRLALAQCANEKAFQPKQSYVASCLAAHTGPIIAASDYVRALPDLIRPYLPTRSLTVLGTDGYGRSDTREKLRHFFEVDRYHIAYAALSALYEAGSVSFAILQAAAKKYGIDATKPDPVTV